MGATLFPGDGQDLMRAWKRAWEMRDVDAAVALFRDDAEARPDPFEDPVDGAIGIRGWWTRFAARYVHTELDAERVWVSGRSVLASWHGALTDRASAERIRVRGFIVFDLDDEGRIGRWRGWPASRIVGIDSTVRPEGGRELLLEGSDGR